VQDEDPRSSTRDRRRRSTFSQDSEGEAPSLSLSVNEENRNTRERTTSSGTSSSRRRVRAPQISSKYLKIAQRRRDRSTANTGDGVDPPPINNTDAISTREGSLLMQSETDRG
jgi:hypothetical protein